MCHKLDNAIYMQVFLFVDVNLSSFLQASTPLFEKILSLFWKKCDSGKYESNRLDHSIKA